MSQHASRRLRDLVAKTRWFTPAFRVFEGVTLAVLGALLPNNPALVGSFLAIMFVFFLFMEVLLYQTEEDIRVSASADAREQAQQQIQAIEDSHRVELTKYRERLRHLRFRSEHYESASVFLVSMLQEFLNRSNIIAVVGADRHPNPTPFYNRGDIRRALHQMCKGFQDYVRIDRWGQELPSESIFFRATFMEVVGEPPKLVYRDWYTPDGREPRSVSAGKTFELGKGVAGKAWERKRPVIEDFVTRGGDPEDAEFTENYPGQRSQYKSMVCVPVVVTLEDAGEHVLGVITVDTNIDGFFGEKGNRDDEQRDGSWIRPYADFIAFVLFSNKMGNKVIA